MDLPPPKVKVVQVIAALSEDEAIYQILDDQGRLWEKAAVGMEGERTVYGWVLADLPEEPNGEWRPI